MKTRWEVCECCLRGELLHELGLVGGNIYRLDSVTKDIGGVVNSEALILAKEAQQRIDELEWKNPFYQSLYRDRGNATRVKPRNFNMRAICANCPYAMEHDVVAQKVVQRCEEE